MLTPPEVENLNLGDLCARSVGAKAAQKMNGSWAEDIRRHRHTGRRIDDKADRPTYAQTFGQMFGRG